MPKFFKVTKTTSINVNNCLAITEEDEGVIRLIMPKMDIPGTCLIGRFIEETEHNTVIATHAAFFNLEDII